MIELLNIDCNEYMSTLPDNSFDLAIVDPDYGIGQNWKKDRYSKFYTHNSTYKNKKIPSAEYFKQLFRVSKNQIIWGGNYYTEHLPARNSWIVWDKDRKFKESHMSECELAWNSFKIPMRIIKIRWNGFIRNEARHGIHPHEKPTSLYRWLLMEYATVGNKILDTHIGSASIALACHDLGFNLTGCEIDKHYSDEAIKRLDNHKKKITLFTYQ